MDSKQCSANETPDLMAALEHSLQKASRKKARRAKLGDRLTMIVAIVIFAALLVGAGVAIASQPVRSSPSGREDFTPSHPAQYDSTCSPTPEYGGCE